jgi:hypothetical protein
MSDMYYTSIIATFSADDEVAARMIGETIRENAQKDLDDGDEVWVEEVLPVGAPQTEHALIHRIERTRNDLIRLRKTDTYDIARELDKIAWALRVKSADSHATYDYGTFLDVVKRVLEGEITL